MIDKNVKNELISIIVPVYNVEKYLSECIDSLIYQTYSNIEIILIDDGSTDSSGDICDNYSKKDKRIKVIHKENTGLSDSRNIGINQSKGNLITFVDSDDVIDTTMIDVLYKNMQKENADISIIAYTLLCKSGNKYPLFSNIYMTLNSKDAIDYSYRMRYFSISACGKLYKKHLFNNIKYPVNKICEDQYTTYKLFYKSNIIVYDSSPLYFYRRRKSSIMNSKISNSFDCILSSKEVLKFTTKIYDSPIESVRLNYVLFCLLFYNSSILKNTFFTRPNKYTTKIIKKNKKLLLNTHILSNFKKIQILIFLYLKPLYVLLYKTFSFFRNLNYFE